MSNPISISSPFTKKMSSGFYSAGRNELSPIASYAYTETVPAPLRRLNTVIQNQGTTEVVLGLDEEGSVLTGGVGIKLYAGQTISLDNYNGPIWIYDSTELNNTVSITESFA